MFGIPHGWVIGLPIQAVWSWVIHEWMGMVGIMKVRPWNRSILVFVGANLGGGPNASKTPARDLSKQRPFFVENCFFDGPRPLIMFFPESQQKQNATKRVVFLSTNEFEVLYCQVVFLPRVHLRSYMFKSFFWPQCPEKKVSET